MDSDNSNEDITEITTSTKSLDLRDDRNLIENVKTRLDCLFRLALTSDGEVMLDVIRSTRKLLSDNKKLPINDIIASPMLAILVEGLKQDSYPNVQFEAAWALTNIVFGDTNQIRAVIRAGAIEHLIRLLKSPQVDVREQSFWALGNIIGDGAEFREFVLGHGFVDQLLAFVNPNTNLPCLRNVAWVICNICRNVGTPLPSIELIKRLTPTLLSFIQHTDRDILTETIWSVSYISETGPEHLQHVIGCGIIPFIIQLMQNQDPKVVLGALRAVDIIATGTNDETQVIIDQVLFKYCNRNVVF